MTDNDKIAGVLRDKFPELDVRAVEFDRDHGTASLYVGNTKKLAYLEDPIVGGMVVPRIYKDKASTITRDMMSRSVLDLAKPVSTYDEDPHTLFKQAMQYYYEEPLVGSVTDKLASIACKGFENDIDDPKIKEFFDAWVFDVKFTEVLEWIFLDLFRTSHVVTYKVVSKYEPRVSNLSPIAGKKLTLSTLMDKITAAKKKKWAKSHIPVGYTILNPEYVNITGNMLFNQTSITLTPPDGLKDLLKKPQSELSQSEADLIKALPSDLKQAAKDGKEFTLDPYAVGVIAYRKAPYERYAKPRLARIFESLNYKQALRNADLSTLDGISNYILKITIGNDEFPVTSQEELESVAKLFNTPSKSFDVVWNHTLQVEKIVSPEIEAILGADKYKQVNSDIEAGINVTRALIDGSSGANAQEVDFAVKSVREEVDYARGLVTRWIYDEYRDIAESMGFDRFPKVRWDDSVLRDDILYMNVIAQLVDRRMLSYHTALETLGFDYETEKTYMSEEIQLVVDGVFGLKGSPFQQTGVQPNQTAPTGTPSNGRPTGQTKKKTPSKDPNNQPDNKTVNPKKSASLQDVMSNLSNEELQAFANLVSTIVKERLDGGA